MALPSPQPCTITKLSPHVYWFSPDSRTDRPSLGAVTGTGGSILLDAGNSRAHLMTCLDQLMAAELALPRSIVLTHWHWDHWFGASALRVPVIAHEETARQIKIQAGYGWSDAALDQRVAEGIEIQFCADMIKAELPDRTHLELIVPNITFDSRITLDLGDVTCEAAHVGGDHAPDSVVMFIPQDRVLFLGDCLYPAIYTPNRYYHTETLFPLLERIMAYEADYYIEGHSDAVITRTEMQAMSDELRLIGTLVNRYKGDRDIILEALPVVVERTPTEDDLDTVDLFVNGYR
jgi:glyoxylase-like metal-dependent hydrolase (beta-lactamase superfamily II)